LLDAGQDRPAVVLINARGDERDLLYAALGLPVARGYPAINAHRRHKPDKMLSRCRSEVEAASEAEAEDGDTAFARCAAGGQRCWQVAILLH
jgi:hypothetical protein